MQNYILAMSHICHAIWTLSPLDTALTMRCAKTRNATRLNRCACHAKWRWRSPKRCACHKKWNSSAGSLKPCKSIAPLTQNYFRHLSTRLQTRENVRKCHACQAKRHYNLLWHLERGEVLQLPPWTRRCHKKTRESRRNMLEAQNNISCET